MNPITATKSAARSTYYNYKIWRLYRNAGCKINLLHPSNWK